GLKRPGCKTPRTASLVEHPPQHRAVGDRRADERFGQLGGGRDLEKIDRRGIETAPMQPRERRVADTRLPRAPRTGDDDASSAREGCGDLPHVLLAPDHLTRRNRLIGGKQVVASLSGHGDVSHYMHRQWRIMRRIRRTRPLLLWRTARSRRGSRDTAASGPRAWPRARQSLPQTASNVRGFTYVKEPLFARTLPLSADCARTVHDRPEARSRAPATDR